MPKPRLVIVGAGPAAIFACLKLTAGDNYPDITIVEKGPDLHRRRCPQKEKGTACLDCPTCSVINGWGGAGAYSDGKLTLSAQVGGFLGEYLGRDDLEKRIEEVDRTFLKHGATRSVYRPDSAAGESVMTRLADTGLTFIPSPVRHLGSDGSRKVLAGMRRSLAGKVKVLFGREARRILVHRGLAAGVATDDGKHLPADFVIVAPGRGGAAWLVREAGRLGLTSTPNPVDIGLRIEVPAEVPRLLTDIFYEAKLTLRSHFFRDLVRTFCMCPYGEVVMESMEGLHTVNGQSYAKRRTQNTNFALLVSTSFTKPFNDPITYGRHIAGLANLLSGGVLVQRLGDFDAGRRSTVERMATNPVRPTLTGAVPGDLSFALPYRYLQDIREMIHALECVIPGVEASSTLLYGVETKFYSSRLSLSRLMETEISGLFAVGDGAGVSRSLVQAAVSGMLAAEAIAARLT